MYKYKIKNLLLLPLTLLLSGCQQAEDSTFMKGWNELSYQRNSASSITNIVRSTEEAVTNGSNNLTSVLGDICIVICILGIAALIYSICKYGISGDKPKEHEDAKKGIFVSLITLALFGIVPLLGKFIIAALHSLGVL